LLFWQEPRRCGSVGRCNNAYSKGYGYCFIYFANPALETGLFILHNIRFTLITLFTAISGSPYIPSIAFERGVGDAILAGLTSPLIITNSIQNFPSATGGSVSSFSGIGLNADLWIKPDIGGIGGNVLSSVSSNAQSVSGLSSPYAVYSGTSMASPYVAGCIALLLEAKGKIGYDAARNALLSTSSPAVRYSSALLDTVARQGAGLINIFNAITSKTVVTPASISLNDTARSKVDYRIRITNNYDKVAQFTIVNEGAGMIQPFVAGDDAIQALGSTPFTADFAVRKYYILNF
jgi:subtilisin family serine protease